jgi:hypothetical protein
VSQCLTSLISSDQAQPLNWRTLKQLRQLDTRDSTAAGKLSLTDRNKTFLQIKDQAQRGLSLYRSEALRADVPQSVSVEVPRAAASIYRTRICRRRSDNGKWRLLRRPAFSRHCKLRTMSREPRPPLYSQNDPASS